MAVCIQKNLGQLMLPMMLGNIGLLYLKLQLFWPNTGPPSMSTIKLINSAKCLLKKTFLKRTEETFFLLNNIKCKMKTLVYRSLLTGRLKETGCKGLDSFMYEKVQKTDMST